MRPDASVLHLDLDAFFAAVEQRDKPSLRGKPVVVGGVGGRGVVATASYEARRYGIRSAMSTREARSRCPHAAFLSGRFHAYRDTSRAVMGLLREVSPLVEPLSLDEAFVDLAAADLPDVEVATVRPSRRSCAHASCVVTGGLTASVGIGSSKFIAKVASDLDKPDGLVVVPPGGEQELLRPMHVSVIPGVGPATAERLRRAGIHTVAELESVTVDELVRLLGRVPRDRPARPRTCRGRPAGGPRARDQVGVGRGHLRHRPHRPEADGGPADPAGGAGRRAAAQARAVRAHRDHQGQAARLHHPQPVLDPRLAHRPRHRGSAAWPAALLAELDTSGGVRLLGVGVSGLADWIQEDLFGDDGEDDEPTARGRGADPAPVVLGARHGRRARRAGARLGVGLGPGRGDGAVRDGRDAPGPVRSYPVDDPALHVWQPPARE